jgi:KDO2-lipid IV(A) lauroyltransferase
VEEACTAALGETGPEEFTIVSALSVLIQLSRLVPLEVGYRLADGISGWQVRLSPSRRAAVEANIRAVTGGTEDLETPTRAVFRNYTRFLFEFLRGPDIPEIPFRFERWDRLQTALARGRGVVLAIPHTGNWEIAGVRMAQKGLSIHAVAGTQLRRGWTEELRRRQASCGIRILPPSVESFRSFREILAANGVVVLLIDGNVTRGGLTVPFGPRRTSFPKGPARLAALTGAALLPAFGRRNADGSLSGEFLDEVAPVEDSSEGIRIATTLLAARFSGLLARHPDQWMIFRRFFPGETDDERGAAA